LIGRSTSEGLFVRYDHGNDAAFGEANV